MHICGLMRVCFEVSDAYNVVTTFEMFSNGKMKIAERLHGKPAIVNFGLPVVGGHLPIRVRVRV